MVNILYITPSANIYGSEKSLVALLKNIDRTKYNPTVLLLRNGPLKAVLEKNKINTILFNSYNYAKFYHNIKFNIKLIKFIKANSFHIIHINLHTQIFKIAPALFLSKLPMVAHIRMHSWIDLLDKIVISKCKKVICVSEAVRKVVTQKRRSDLFSRIREDRVTVIHSGRDLSIYEIPIDKNKLRRELGIKKDNRLIGFVGSLTPRKSADLFLHAASLVSGHKNNMQFLIAGDIYDEKDMPYKKYVISLSKKLNLENRCIFTGFRKDIDNIIRIFDVLVVPSKRDALSCVLMEGMAAGVPIVTTAVDGSPEALGANEAGILLNSLDAKDFSAAIIKLLDNDESSKQMGKIGKYRARKYFDIKVSTKNIEQIYELILSGKK